MSKATDKAKATLDERRRCADVAGKIGAQGWASSEEGFRGYVKRVRGAILSGEDVPDPALNPTESRAMAVTKTSKALEHLILESEAREHLIRETTLRVACSPLGKALYGTLDQVSALDPDAHFAQRCRAVAVALVAAENSQQAPPEEEVPMSKQFLRPLDHLRMIKANDPDVPRERAVRLFKESPETWAFQLRAPLGLGFAGLRDGKDFIVASASCSLDDLRAMRDALDLAIGDATSIPAEIEKIADDLCDNKCTMAHVEALRDLALKFRGCCGENETGSGEHDEECPEAGS